MGERFAQGDLCDLFHCTLSGPPPSKEDHAKGKTYWERLVEDDGPRELRGVVKVSRQIGDNDLVENEARILGHLYPESAKEEKFYRYLPKLLGSTSEGSHQVNVLTAFEGAISFADILKAYPAGIDYQDLAWMLKRLFAGLGFAHTQGVIHGAILPPHVLVHPTGHGAKLIDWSYAVTAEDKCSLKAYPADWRAYYPPEVFLKRLPTTATDIYMAAKCFLALLGGNVETNVLPDAVPAEVKAFLAECLRETPSARPQDAWELHDRFDEILQKLVGKPHYRAFHIGASAKP